MGNETPGKKIDSNNKKEEKIKLENGLDTQEAGKINKIAEDNPEDFSKNLKKALDGIENKKNMAESILRALDNSPMNKGDIAIFKMLLNNISRLDANIINTPDYKKRSSIVNSDDNFTLWNEITKSGNIKDIVDDESITKQLGALAGQDQDLKNYLTNTVSDYKQKIEARQQKIQEFPLYQRSAYGVTYDKDT